MKRVIALALAATLLGSTAASADPWGHRSYGHGWHHGYYRHDHGDAAAAIGLGIFALGALAIISSQQHDYDARYAPPPPPPPGDYRNAPRAGDYDAPPPPDEYGDDY
ncbi:MAG TPA: hypothetical protein VMS78_12690 [Rhizomicrobium sp.]|nr:hypothetical protein [Rhizomicrobium sp.]